MTKEDTPFLYRHCRGDQAVYGVAVQMRDSGDLCRRQIKTKDPQKLSKFSVRNSASFYVYATH